MSTDCIWSRGTKFTWNPKTQSYHSDLEEKTIERTK